MKKNMGTADKAIRILVAVAIILIYFTTNLLNGTWAVVLLVISGAFILTSFVSFCPLYAPFGINTRSKKNI